MGGGNGEDHIYGGAGNDGLDRQNGNDTLVDTSGADSMSGNLGNDSINVQDGVGGDTANGGLGSDTCTVDGADTACPALWQRPLPSMRAADRVHGRVSPATRTLHMKTRIALPRRALSRVAGTLPCRPSLFAVTGQCFGRRGPVPGSTYRLCVFGEDGDRLAAFR